MKVCYIIVALSSEFKYSQQIKLKKDKTELLFFYLNSSSHCIMVAS